MKRKKLKIGVFDSGLGGLTIVSSILKTLSDIELYYIADTKYAPYGEKTQTEVLDYSFKITQHLIEKYAIDALVIACNTATSAAIATLRLQYPHLIIIGTEPGINPAMQKSKSKKVGILATLATLKGKKYHHLVTKLSQKYEVEVFEQACPGLVQQIEKGEVDTLKTLALLEGWLAPMREVGVDSIVLGCTHYILVSTAIQKVMQKEIILVDVAHAISQRLLLLLKQKPQVIEEKNRLFIYATAQINISMVESILKDCVVDSLEKDYAVVG